MGQKINPNLFRLERTNEWKSKYCRKKKIDESIYLKQDLDLRDFINKFFKNYGKTINTCKIQYLDKSISIFISYHNTLYKTKKKAISKTQKAWDKKNITFKQKCLKRVTSKKSSFIKIFFESIAHFTKQRFKIFLTVHRLPHIKKLFKNKLLIKKIKASLKMYREKNKPSQEKKTRSYKKKLLINKQWIKPENELPEKTKKDSLNEEIHSLINFSSLNKSAELLATILAKKLKKFNYKKHHYFFWFIKHVLTIIKQKMRAKFKGVKLQIKGRLSGRPRAKRRTILIGNDISVFNIYSKIDYAETSAFTQNGTLGIKVWVHYQ